MWDLYRAVDFAVLELREKKSRGRCSLLCLVLLRESSSSLLKGLVIFVEVDFSIQNSTRRGSAVIRWCVGTHPRYDQSGATL